MISGLVTALVEAARDVGAGAGVGAHAGEHDPPQRMVGLAVPAAVEPMPACLARRCVDRRDAAQVRPGGFVADPFGVVAGGDQQDRGGVDTDAVAGASSWACCGHDELVEDDTSRRAISSSMREDTSPEGPHARAWWRRHDGSPSARGRSAARLGRRADAWHVAELFTQLVGGGEAEVTDLVEALVAGRAAGTLGDQQRPDRFHVAVRGLGRSPVARPDSAARAASTASTGSDLPCRRRT